MKCPKCDWDLKNTPKDELAQWQCPRHGCDWMATEGYMENMTEEQIAQIKKDVQDIIQYRQQAQAQKEIDKIERARRDVEDKQTVYDVARKYKGIACITDFMKEKKDVQRKM